MKISQAQNITPKVNILDPEADGNCFFRVMAWNILEKESSSKKLSINAIDNKAQESREGFCDWAMKQGIKFNLDPEYPQVRTWQDFKANPRLITNKDHNKALWMREGMIQNFAKYIERDIVSSYQSYTQGAAIAQTSIYKSDGSIKDAVYMPALFVTDDTEDFQKIQKMQLSSNPILLTIEGGHFQGIIKSQAQSPLSSSEITTILPKLRELFKAKVDNEASSNADLLNQIEDLQQELGFWTGNAHSLIRIAQWCDNLAQGKMKLPVHTSNNNNQQGVNKAQQKAEDDKATQDLIQKIMKADLEDRNKQLTEEKVRAKLISQMSTEEQEKQREQYQKYEAVQQQKKYQQQKTLQQNSLDSISEKWYENITNALNTRNLTPQQKETLSGSVGAYLERLETYKKELEEKQQPKDAVQKFDQMANDLLKAFNNSVNNYAAHNSSMLQQQQYAQYQQQQYQQQQQFEQFEQSKKNMLNAMESQYYAERNKITNYTNTNSQKLTNAQNQIVQQQLERVTANIQPSINAVINSSYGQDLNALANNFSVNLQEIAQSIFSYIHECQTDNQKIASALKQNNSQSQDWITDTVQKLDSYYNSHIKTMLATVEQFKQSVPESQKQELESFYNKAYAEIAHSLTVSMKVVQKNPDQSQDAINAFSKLLGQQQEQFTALTVKCEKYIKAYKEEYLPKIAKLCSEALKTVPTVEKGAIEKMQASFLNLHAEETEWPKVFKQIENTVESTVQYTIKSLASNFKSFQTDMHKTVERLKKSVPQSQQQELDNFFKNMIAKNFQNLDLNSKEIKTDATKSKAVLQKPQNSLKQLKENFDDVTSQYEAYITHKNKMLAEVEKLQTSVPPSLNKELADFYQTAHVDMESMLTKYCKAVQQNSYPSQNPRNAFTKLLAQQDQEFTKLTSKCEKYIKAFQETFVPQMHQIYSDALKQTTVNSKAYKILKTEDIKNVTVHLEERHWPTLLKNLQDHVKDVINGTADLPDAYQIPEYNNDSVSWEHMALKIIGKTSAN
jgi:hypothetical protein